jgi:hypothetical protein
MATKGKHKETLKKRQCCDYVWSSNQAVRDSVINSHDFTTTAVQCYSYSTCGQNTCLAILNGYGRSVPALSSCYFNIIGSELGLNW